MNAVGNFRLCNASSKTSSCALLKLPLEKSEIDTAKSVIAGHFLYVRVVAVNGNANVYVFGGGQTYVFDMRQIEQGYFF